ncbi:MAG: hypothetical protein ACPW61_07655 [Methyloligella sp. ZOD6]
MARSFLRIGQLAAVFGFALAALCLAAIAPKTAEAGPFVLSAPERVSPVTKAQIFKRGRTPQYPYYIRRGPPGGWDAYIGFVPYEKGNIENQALRRSQSPSIWLRPEADPQPNSR